MDFRREKKESPESRRAKWGLRLDTSAAWPTGNWQESNGFLWSTHEEGWLTLCNWYLTQYWMMRGKILKMCHNRTGANWHQEKYLFNNYPLDSDMTYFSQSIANSCFLYYNHCYVHTITSIVFLSLSYFEAIFCRLSTFFDLFSLLELTKNLSWERMFTTFLFKLTEHAQKKLHPCVIISFNKYCWWSKLF